jgi:TolA-binding protein
MFASCGRVTEEEAWNSAQQFYEQKNFQEAVKSYELLVEKYPQSPKAPLACAAIASIYSNDVKDNSAAIRYYLLIVDKYPQSKEAPNALFTVAFTYNNELKDFEKAKLYYERFLEKYPENEMASSARFELANLGKDPNEILGAGLKSASADSSRPRKK